MFVVIDGPDECSLQPSTAICVVFGDWLIQSAARIDLTLVALDAACCICIGMNVIC